MNSLTYSQVKTCTKPCEAKQAFVAFDTLMQFCVLLEIGELSKSLVTTCPLTLERSLIGMDPHVVHKISLLIKDFATIVKTAKKHHNLSPCVWISIPKYNIRVGL